MSHRASWVNNHRLPISHTADGGIRRRTLFSAHHLGRSHGIVSRRRPLCLRWRRDRTTIWQHRSKTSGKTGMIESLLWPEDRIEHIARHNVSPEEFDQVCFGRALLLRAKAQGPNPVYHVLGQTDAGRYVFCVVIAFPDGYGYPVTARTMTAREQRRYRQWRNQ